MTEIFVFGTLCHLPLLRAVSGCDLPVQQAHLPGSEVVWVAGKSWPMLVARAGARAEGYLIAPDEAALARLDFYEACFGYHREPVTIEIDGLARVVQVWRPAEAQGTPGDAWSLADWAASWGEISLLAAEEVMRQSWSSTAEEIGRRFWMIRARAQSQVQARNWHRPGQVGSAMGQGDVTVLEQGYPYERFFGVGEMRLTARRFAGEMSGVQDRAIFRAADAVTVLPYDPQRDRILLIEQIRIGAFAHGDPAPWMLEPIAGIIDAGETAETSARREAVEEAGLTLGALHHVSKYYPSPGAVSQVITSYVGLADLPDDVAGVGGAEAEGEDILSHLIPFDQAEEMLAGGDMANAPLILSFQWLQLNRDRLRRAV